MSEKNSKPLSKYAKKMKANSLHHEQRCLQRRLNMQAARMCKQQELQLALNGKLTITHINNNNIKIFLNILLTILSSN